MTIAIVIPESWEPGELVRWSSTLARSKEQHLLIVRVRRLANRHKRRKTLHEMTRERSPLMDAIREHAGDFAAADHNDPQVQKSVQTRRRGDPLPLSVLLIELDYAELLAGVLAGIKALRVVLLIVPRRQGVRISKEDADLERQLFAEVPCEVLQLRPGRRFCDPRDPILVTSDARQPPPTVRKLDAAIGPVEESHVTAVYVGSDGEPSRRKKRRRAGSAMQRSPKLRLAPAITSPSAAEDVLDGVRSYATATGHDMLIVGAGDHLTEDRKIRARVPDQLMAQVDNSTIVVVRNALPLKGRLIKSIEHRKKKWVPQLDRRGRVELVQRLQNSAEWNIDFLLLIFLATLLAALGLVVDSAPVVIGAMLVAPLMAPMLGLGMSVVQGNRQMADKCLAIVGRGFLLSFVTGCGVGSLRMLFTSGVTGEMSSRGAPGVLDLAIASVSGMVAAYAFGRPHLLSVLPGIAIATSLVPPVATSGLALVALDLNVAIGAAMLFLANFVAIVLGSAFGLWIVGMRGPREANPFTEWAQKWIVGFFGIAICLAVFFSFRGNPPQLHAASPAGATGGLAPSIAASAHAHQPGNHAESSSPATSSSPRDPSGTPPEHPDKQPQVVHKPVPANAPPIEPPEAGPLQQQRVTVVIPKESPAAGSNASVQIDGLQPADVAGLLDEMLGNAEEPSHSHATMLLIIAVSVISLGYFGWRNRGRF